MNLINPDELEQLKSDIVRIIDDVDCSNPLQVLGFAKTLMDVGQTYIIQTNQVLISHQYSPEQIQGFKEKLKEAIKEEEKK